MDFTIKMALLGMRPPVCAGLLILSMVAVSEAKYDVCPAELGKSVQDMFGASGFLQETIWHRIPCPSFTPGVRLDGVIWYKGSSIDDPSTVRLITRDLRGGGSIDSPADDNETYSMSTNNSLVIEGVQDGDKGRYLCQVIPYATGTRVGRVDVQVIGNSFPGGTSEVSSTASFHPGRRQTLPCECASQTPDVVYWSTGEGVTTDTQIIGVRFSDGATLQIQHGADYSIGSDASLKVNSLYNVQDTQRFWCHVFQSDGTLRSCNVTVLISDQQQPNHALKASPTSFYLLGGENQTLPCPSWNPGNATCEVQWFKIDGSGRRILLSSHDVDTNSEFDFASDFSLIIKSVDGEDSGKYQCDAGADDLVVKVIGEDFPLDGGEVFANTKTEFEVGEKLPLACQAVSARLGSPATLFWSFGKPDHQTTTVIGKLNIPGGSDLGDNDCFSITPEGSLHIDGSCGDYDNRYWCHVFPENDLLIRSYVDVTRGPSVAVQGLPESTIIGIVIAACCVFVLIIIICVCLCRTRCYFYRKTVRKQLDALEEDALNYVKCRRKTIELLREAADHLTEVNKKIEEARVAGGAVGLVGSGLVIAGFAASFFSGGLSLGIAAAGAAVGAAGGMVQVGGIVVEYIEDKDAEAKAKQILDADYEAFKKVEHRLEQIDASMTDIHVAGKAARLTPTTGVKNKTSNTIQYKIKTVASIYEFARVGSAVGRVGKAAGQSALKALPKFGKALAVGSAVFSFVSIPIDIHTVITSSAKLENEAVPEVAKSIKEIIKELECPSEKDMKKLLRKLRWKLIFKIFIGIRNKKIEKGVETQDIEMTTAEFVDSV